MELLVRDEKTNKVYVDWVVVERLYKLVCDQKAFYRVRSKSLLKSCQSREEAFLLWFQEQQSRIDKESS